MKALGRHGFQIVWVFLFQGMVVGVLGNAVGVGLGMALIRWRNEVKELLAAVLHIEIFPASIYQFSQDPRREWCRADVPIICVSAFVICLAGGAAAGVFRGAARPGESAPLRITPLQLMPSFDIVSEVDKQEIDNAINQALKELATRFDFKGSSAKIEWD